MCRVAALFVTGAFITWAFGSCAMQRLGTYTVVMDNVDFTPAAATAQEIMFSTGTWQDGSTYYRYKDPLLQLDGRLTNTRFAFTLKNNSADTLHIDWASAFYIDQHGDSLRVIHDSIDFATRYAPQPPTAVAPGTQREDFMLPIANIQDDPTNYSLWKILYLFYDKEQNIGQKVAFVLPVIYRDTTRDYHFYFTVDTWIPSEQKSIKLTGDRSGSTNTENRR